MNEKMNRVYYLANDAIEILQRAYQDCPHQGTEDLLQTALQKVRELQRQISDIAYP